MGNLIVLMNVSLDGFADHTVAVADDDQLHAFATGFLNNVDTMLFGRVTYQLMESYWPIALQDPKATRSIVEFAHKINSMPKIVFSKTLEKVEWYNTRLVRDNIVEEVIKLKQGPGKDLSIGGVSICQDFIRLGLIDEYWLLVQPVVWNNGRRLFDCLRDRINLKLIDIKTFKSGVVALHYLPDKK